MIILWIIYDIFDVLILMINLLVMQGKRKEMKGRFETHQPIPGQSKFTFEQLNTLLDRWPHAKAK